MKNAKSKAIAKKKSWTDSLDRSKYTPETIARWKKDESRAGKQFQALQKNPFRHLPSTAPAP